MKIAILATDNTMVSGIYGLFDVFFAANFCIETRYGKNSLQKLDYQIVTINDEPVKGYNGIDIKPTVSIKAFKSPDVVITSANAKIVIGCCDSAIDYPFKEQITSYLKDSHSKGAILASYCTGSFMIAATGLLAGKSATTHWRVFEMFRKLYPFTRLETDNLIVDNGDTICSGGALSYVDMALHIVSRFVSKDISSDCAKLLVFDPIREKQSPYVSFQQQKDHNDQPILKAQEYIESHYKNDISMDELAQRVGLGSRTFKRRFKLATRENPINYLQRIRVEQAKQKLEKTTESINKIIWSVGYEDISSFRQLFKRFTGLTPKDYRQKFAA